MFRTLAGVERHGGINYWRDGRGVLWRVDSITPSADGDYVILLGNGRIANLVTMRAERVKLD